MMTHKYCFEAYEGWDQDSVVWIATTNLYSRLAVSYTGDARYCLDDVLNLVSPSKLTVMDKNGVFKLEKLHFPVFRQPVFPGGIGHWFYLCVKPNAQLLEVGDSAEGDRTFEAAVIAKFWDDICTLSLGYNYNAQSWEVQRVQIGRQQGVWECGFYALNGIACSCVGQDATLRPEEVEKVKLLMAQDFAEGRILAPDILAPSPSLPPISRQRLPDLLGSTDDNSTLALGANVQAARPESPPAQAPSQDNPLLLARQQQWDPVSGTRQRACNFRSWRKPRPRKAHQYKAPSGRNKPDVDCPDLEHVLLDGPAGIPLQVLSLNLGISGLKGSLDQLGAYLRRRKPQSTPAVLHLQEARLRADEVRKWRKRVSAILPEYSLYAHCRHHGSRNTTAVVTLVRKELVKWVSPLNVKTPESVLSGRLVALKYAPPNVPNPMVLANIWMPHSGYKAVELEAAHQAFGDLVMAWKQQQYLVLAVGDWNAAIFPEHRPAPDRPIERGARPHQTARTHAADQVFAQMRHATGLQPVTDDIQPTWESSNGMMRSRIDHALCTDGAVVYRCDIVPDVTSSDHSAVRVYLQEDIGCWNAGQHKPICTRPNLDFTELDNLAPEFQRKLGEAQAQCTDLVSLEKAMWQAATEVYGIKPGNTGRKPFLNNKVLGLKRAIKVCRTLLYIYNRGNVNSSSIGNQWNLVRDRLTSSDCVPLLSAFFTEADESTASEEVWRTLTPDECKNEIQNCITSLRARIRLEVRAMQRATLADNIAKKRASLETGKRGIQKAMGKGVADARMSALETTHPSTIRVRLNQHDGSTVQALCMKADPECKINTSSHVLKCTVSRLQCAFDVLCVLQDAGVSARLEHGTHTVDKPDDILSALEHFMGSEGKAREMVCPECKSSDLTCLSRVTDGRREIGWFCEECRQCCEYERAEGVYNQVPWDEECVTEQRRVPDDPKFRLMGEVGWEDFTQLVSQLPNRKAPGDTLVPAELWKNSPE